MTKLIFSQHEGFTNTYVRNEIRDLGHINFHTHEYLSNKAPYEASDLYQIADTMEETKGNPSRRELFEAHNKLLDKNKRLRKRVTELTDKLKHYESS